MGSHSVVYLAFVLIVPFLGAAIAVDRKECHMKLGHPGNFHCCKDIQTKREKNHLDLEAVKECFQTPNKPPPSCDTDICVAKKRGFLADDGSIDKAAIETFIVKETVDDPELTEALKTKCVNDDVADYGPPDMCELTKIRHCIGLHTVMACKEWDDAGPCSGIKEQVEVCRSVV